MYKKIFLILFIISASCVNYGQTHNVFIDDTLFVIKCYGNTGLYTSDKRIVCDGNSSYISYLLKDSLSDGQWSLYNLYRKDSTKISYKKLLMTASYKDSLKHGTQKYFYFLPSRNEQIVVFKEEYVKGKREGVAFYLEGKIWGHFKNDLPDGLWIHQYDRCFFPCKSKSYKNWIERLLNIRRPCFFSGRFYREPSLIRGFEYIITYESGIVKQWVALSRIDGRVYEYGVGSLANGNCVVNYFYTSGTIRAEYIFKDTFLIKIKEYDENGNLTKVIKYDLNENAKKGDNCHFIEIYNQYRFIVYNDKPCHGKIIEYDVEGNAIQITKYVNGIIE